jgi:hypothetical protein
MALEGPDKAGRRAIDPGQMRDRQFEVGVGLGLTEAASSRHAQPCCAQMPPLIRRAAKLRGVQRQAELKVHVCRNHRLS